MVDREAILNLMRESLISALEFIKSSKDKFPFPTEDYVDVEVDYERKEWRTFSTKTVNLYGWIKKQEMFSLPELKRAVSYLYTLETKDNSGTKDRGQTFPQPSEQEMLDRLRDFWIIPFVSAYINKFSLSFNDSNFNDTFKVWFERRESSNLGRRILVLRNFFLEGMESLDLLGYRIRPLRDYEIRLLIGMGSYNARIPNYQLWNLPSDLKYDLNPMYCVEVPPQIFQNDNKELTSEYIKNRLLGLLLTFKDGTISMETELNYDPIAEFQINTGAGTIASYSELHHYFTSPYSLSQSEYDKLREYETPYQKINLDEAKTLGLAIRRFLSANWRFDWEDILIDYMIALEALLSNTGKEINYRISLGVAVLLNENPLDRQKTFEIMKGFYNLRSKIVHGSAGELDKARIKLQRYFPEGSPSPGDTLREYIRHIIQEYVYLCSGVPSGKERDHFLKKLDEKILGLK